MINMINNDALQDARDMHVNVNTHEHMLASVNAPMHSPHALFVEHVDSEHMIENRQQVAMRRMIDHMHRETENVKKSNRQNTNVTTTNARIQDQGRLEINNSQSLINDEIEESPMEESVNKPPENNIAKPKSKVKHIVTHESLDHRIMEVKNKVKNLNPLRRAKRVQATDQGQFNPNVPRQDNGLNAWLDANLNQSDNEGLDINETMYAKCNSDNNKCYDIDDVPIKGPVRKTGELNRDIIMQQVRDLANNDEIPFCRSSGMRIVNAEPSRKQVHIHEQQAGASTQRSRAPPKVQQDRNRNVQDMLSSNAMRAPVRSHIRSSVRYETDVDNVGIMDNHNNEWYDQVNDFSEEEDNQQYYQDTPYWQEISQAQQSHIINDRDEIHNASAQNFDFRRGFRADPYAVRAKQHRDDRWHDEPHYYDNRVNKQVNRYNMMQPQCRYNEPQRLFRMERGRDRDREEINRRYRSGQSNDSNSVSSESSQARQGNQRKIRSGINAKPTSSVQEQLRYPHFSLGQISGFINMNLQFHNLTYEQFIAGELVTINNGMDLEERQGRTELLQRISQWQLRSNVTWPQVRNTCAHIIRRIENCEISWNADWDHFERFIYDKIGTLAQNKTKLTRIRTSHRSNQKMKECGFAEHIKGMRAVQKKPLTLVELEVK